MTQPTGGEPSTHSLVMPFVVVKSAGGELDDMAFAAGWDCGALDAELGVCAQVGATPAGRYVKTPALPQLDLIAMRHGYTVTVDAKDEDEQATPGWKRVEFARISTCDHGPGAAAVGD